MTCSLHITYSLLKSEDLKKLLIKVLRITLPYIVGYKAQVNQIPSIYVGFTFHIFVVCTSIRESTGNVLLDNGLQGLVEGLMGGGRLDGWGS